MVKIAYFFLNSVFYRCAFKVFHLVNRFVVLEAEFQEVICCGKGCIQAVAAKEGLNEVN